MESLKESGLKGEYYALAFRTPVTGHVQFLNMSALHIYILTRLMEEQLPLNAFKGEIASHTGIESARYLDESLTAFIQSLMDKKLILGSQKD
jgi:hypothetical protein